MNANILVIEDDTLLNQMIVQQLKNMGHTATGVDSIGKSREYLSQYEPDLIISDARLPDGDCIDELPVQSESYPVIVLTAYGTVKNAVEAIQAGAEDYLTKPVSPEELSLTVQRVLDIATLKADHQHIIPTQSPLRHLRHLLIDLCTAAANDTQNPAFEQAFQMIILIKLLSVVIRLERIVLMNKHTVTERR